MASSYLDSSHRRRLLPALFTMLAISLLPWGAGAMTFLFHLQPGATIQVEGEAAVPLSGHFTMSCRPAGPVLGCGRGAVPYNILEMELSSTPFSMAASGRNNVIQGPTQAVGLPRFLTLRDVGPTSAPAHGGINSAYSFEPQVLVSTPTRVSYRIWNLVGNLGSSGWIPVPGDDITPGEIFVEGFLNELIYDLRVGEQETTVPSQMAVSFTALLVPEPATGALVATGLLSLAARRRRA